MRFLVAASLLSAFSTAVFSIVMARFFFFNDTATTEIYTLSLHDALPICSRPTRNHDDFRHGDPLGEAVLIRSEEHTSELQSRPHLVCRLLLEKKKKFEEPRY